MPKSTYDKYSLLKEYLTNGKRTIDDCASYMGHDKRTAYRAIKVLAKDPNFRKVKNGRQACFYMEDTAKSKNAELILQLEKIMKGSNGSAQEARLTGPLQKLIDKLKKRDEDAYPDAISVNNDLVIDLGPFAACDFEKEADKYDRYLQAIKANQKIKIDYLHTENGEITKYTLCPIKLIMRIDTLYLFASYKNDEGVEIKHPFVFNQIKRMSIMSETFPPIKVNTAELYRFAFSKWIPNLDENPAQDIVLEATQSWSKALFSRANFASEGQGKYVERGGKAFLEMNLSITPDFKSWLFGILDAVKIHKPESLKKDAESYLNAALKAFK